VENQPGHKNAGKMRVFVDAAWTGCTGTPVRQVLRRMPPPRL
jgi:hypothetical protein